MNIEHSALLVDDYDEAIRFFVDALGFELVDVAGNRWDLLGPCP